MRRLRGVWSGIGHLFVLCIIVLVPRIAEAQGAVAQSLFDEGKRLMSQGKYSKACQKFAASEEAQPTTGALLNLASCHQKLGKTATAWAEFKRAIARARADGRADRVEFAKKKARELERKLSRVTIAAPQSVANLEGLIVRLDAARLPAGSFNVALPIDPGVHMLELTAGGYKRWAKSFTITGSQQRATVKVPELTRLKGSTSLAIGTVPKLDGLVVKVDSKKLAPSEYGTPQTLAPGEHTLSASAPGYDSWSKTVTLKDNGESIRVDIPELQQLNKAAKAPTGGQPSADSDYIDSHTAPTLARRRRRTQRSNFGVGRLSGLVLAGLGIAAGGGGIVFGLVARNHAQTAVDDGSLCPSYRCTSKGWDYVEAARQNATYATILIPSGSLAMLIGLGLIIFSGNAGDVALEPHGLTPMVADGNSGIQYTGTF